MNSFSMLYRDITCGAAAALITLMLSLTFLQSTSLPPGARAGTSVFLQVQPQHAWFGQPEPAVLVD
ncbi:MAG TPA: hypothetical protein VGY90_01675 [Steroidobacteraceae bacterium]|jgi:hypothetical protein|nr:hypothetical protein [Steroidobacteraceae bacterium]